MDINTLEEKLGIANLSDAEKLALVKGIESNVQASKAAVKAQEAGQYASLVVDAIKRIKNDLETRFNELNGIIDVKAKTLQDGKDGLQGAKGEKGDRGFDGTNGKDGYNGKDGIDGVDGKDGVGVQDAYIDFDGSLIIKLTDGTEINVGEVVPMDVAEKIKVIGNGGGTSQSVLDSLESLQDQINTLTGIDGELGTMAQQDANAVAITGGTINGTTVGATTAAAGTFTALSTGTLTATGQTSLGGAAGSESFRVLTAGASPNAYATIQGSSFSTAYFGFGGSATNGNLYFQSKAAGTLTFQTNNGSQTQLNVTHTASAVNYVQVTGAATGGAPTITAQGSDSNVQLSIFGKNAGSVVIGNNTNRVAASFTTGGSINYLQLSGTSSTFGPVLSAQGSDTNIPLVLQPKGTGALQAQQTDSTATGGNARGANAVDWQTNRGAANQVASGSYSVVSGGASNRASSTYSLVVGGNNNASTGFGSVVVGGNTNSVSNSYAFSGAGQLNTVSGYPSAVVTGVSNTAAGFHNFIGAGFTNSGTSGSAVTTQSATMNGTTAVTLSGSNASIKVGQFIAGTSIADETYVAAISGTSLTLSKNASGSSTSTLSFYTPHGVVVGGGNNQATGSYSFIGGGGDAGTAGNRNVASGDWSFVGGGNQNTASGIGAVVVGGGANLGSNIASNISSFIGSGGNNRSSAIASAVVSGNTNTANSSYSFVASGTFGTTRGINGNHVFPACIYPIATNSGVSQSALLILGRQTTDATATVLTSDTSSANTGNQVILPNNSAYFFKGEVIAGVTGGGNTKGWTIEGVIKRGANAASTTVVGVTVMSSYGDAGAVTWTIAAAADTTNGGLKITATGQAATTIRWVCKIETTEMTF